MFFSKKTIVILLIAILSLLTTITAIQVKERNEKERERIEHEKWIENERNYKPHETYIPLPTYGK